MAAESDPDGGCGGVLALDRGACFEQTPTGVRRLHDAAQCPVVGDPHRRTAARLGDDGEPATYAELGAAMGVEYTPRMAVMSAGFLRSYPMWGMSEPDPDVGLGDSRDTPGASEMLDAGAVAAVVVKGAVDVGGGLGLFAGAAGLAAGAPLGEYAGMLGPDRHDHGHDAYGCGYPSVGELGAALSAQSCGNVVRCANHAPDGAANAAFRRVLHRGLVRVLCVALRGIEPGEQILVDYGTSYWATSGVTPAVLS